MRREFPARVKREAYKRAEGRCEECGVGLRTGHIRYDHRIPDTLGGEPTLENCQVLCRACDAFKTYRRDAPNIAKSNRQRDRHIGIKRRTRFRGWRRFDGTVVKAGERDR